MTIKVGDVWFRYRDVRYASGVSEWGDVLPGKGRLAVELNEYNVTSVTPKGVWLGYFPGEKFRFVRLGCRKQFAHPTKLEAIKSFKSRKQRQLGIYQARAEQAQEALRIVGDASYEVQE